MANDKLPTPATQQDMYAYATVVELRRLNANLEQLIGTIQGSLPPLPEQAADEVELKEPVPAPAKPAHRDSKKKAAE